MDTYSLQRLILGAQIGPTEAFIGMVLALHLNRKTGKIRIKQGLIAKECRCSDRTVRKAIKALVDAGVFSSKRTGRATMLEVLQAPGKICGRVDRKPRSGLIGTHVPVRDKKTMPWDYDLTYSTRFEEEQKRPLMTVSSQMEPDLKSAAGT